MSKGTSAYILQERWDLELFRAAQTIRGHCDDKVLHHTKAPLIFLTPAENAENKSVLQLFASMRTFSG